MTDKKKVVSPEELRAMAERDGLVDTVAADKEAAEAVGEFTTEWNDHIDDEGECLDNEPVTDAFVEGSGDEDE